MSANPKLILMSDGCVEVTVRVTVKEMELLELLSKGIGVKGSAQVLGCSRRTMTQRSHYLYAKLGASNAAEAVGIGYRTGLLK